MKMRKTFQNLKWKIFIGCYKMIDKKNEIDWCKWQKRWNNKNKKNAEDFLLARGHPSLRLCFAHADK